MPQLVQPLSISFPPGARVLVAEPDPARAMELGAVLAHAGVDITVILTGEAARREAADRATVFDAALVHADLLESEGDDIVTLLRARSRPCFSVVVVPEDREELGRVALTLGALEAVPQSCTPRFLLQATVRAAEASRALWDRLFAGTASPRSAPHVSLHDLPRARPLPELHDAVTKMSSSASLSPRESSVLELMVAGFRYVEIGRELRITPRTVKMHAANVRKKAGARNRYELLRKVYECRPRPEAQ